MDAMATTRVYQEGGKYYVSCDLAVLPDGFKWVPSSRMFDKNIYEYTFGTNESDWIGTTGHMVIELKDIKSLPDTAPVSFSLRIKSKETNVSTFSAGITSSVKNQIESKSVKGDYSWSDYDTSAIYAGIK